MGLCVLPHVELNMYDVPKVQAQITAEFVYYFKHDLPLTRAMHFNP